MMNGLCALRDWMHLALGWVMFRLTRKTPAYSYQALIRLFCRSGGAANDRISNWISLCNRTQIDFTGLVGVLGSVERATLLGQVATLREKGFLVFPSALSSEICDRMMLFARDTPATVRRMDGQPATAPRSERCDPLHPKAVRYDYSAQALLHNEDVQGLLADPTLIAIAQEYLGCLPRADVLSMWWHTNFHSQPDSEAAQLYHFDMDRIRWLKVFIYLTDVGPADGAHSFIQGSHRTGAISPELLSKGYVRLSDEEVIRHFGEGNRVDFCAPRGTVIVEDTRGLHKGNVVQPHGHSRLMLQMQFSNSLFGAEITRTAIHDIVNPALKDLVRKFPGLYEQYL
ncbi:MAG: phytanoyl-CoA dioxygenase family protein [Pseudomonadota bacterium]